MNKIFLVLIISLFSMQSASALTYLNIYLDESGRAEFLGETDALSLSLPSGINLSEGKIRGFTNELTNKQGEIWTFSYSLSNSEIRLILPEESSIKNIPTGEVYLERNRISVYSENSVYVRYTVEEKSATPNNYILSAFIIILIILALIYWKRIIKLGKKEKKVQSSKKKEIDSLFPLLHERERLILTELKKLKRAKSSYLRKKCGLPKASFSRHIQELERKSLIKRVGEGRNKLIILAYK